MKNRHFYLEFILISCFFLIPPLFVNQIRSFSVSWNSLLFIIFELFIAIFLYTQNEKNDSTHKNQIKLFSFLVNQGLTLLVFGLLCLSSVIFNILAYYVKSEDIEVILPQKASEYFLYIIVFLMSAFFEEVLYRKFLPESLIRFCNFIRNEKILRIAKWSAEIIAVLVFAFAHRYLGYLAVLNAFVSGIILRLCYIKSKSIFPGFIAHAAYNIFSCLILMK